MILEIGLVIAALIAGMGLYLDHTKSPLVKKFLEGDS